MKSLTILLLCWITNAASSWVKEMENSDLFEGDIKLTDEDIGSNGYASIVGGRWPNNVVPYELSGMSSSNHKYVLRAIDEYHKHTCLKFVKRTNEGAYLRFYPGGGCSSLVGYVRGRVNDVSLANGCLQLGTVLHEIGHSIGLYHEQSRPDRDDFITINWNNIQSSMRFNFDKHDRNSINSLGFPYDYDSMMHYGETAFGGGRVTIVTKDRSKQKVIGTIQGFSEIDIQQINAMYNCGSNRTTLPPTAPPQCVAGQDLDDRCQGWANTGYCSTTDPNYLAIMKRKCCKSCEGSTTCSDKDTRCEYWEKRGECKINPNYMLVNCQKSCNVCK